MMLKIKQRQMFALMSALSLLPLPEGNKKILTFYQLQSSFRSLLHHREEELKLKQNSS